MHNVTRKPKLHIAHEKIKEGMHFILFNRYVLEHWGGRLIISHILHKDSGAELCEGPGNVGSSVMEQFERLKFLFYPERELYITSYLRLLFRCTPQTFIKYHPPLPIASVVLEIAELAGTLDFGSK